MPRTADVVVIGGGLHGCSTALHLAMRGLKPILVEKDYAGRHASGVNAGGVRQLARHIAEIPLSIASMDLWERIEELVGDDCGFASHGTVLVAESEEELTRISHGRRVHRSPVSEKVVVQQRLYIIDGRNSDADRVYRGLVRI